MTTEKRNYARTVTNGAKEEFTIRTPADDPRDLNWWADTCLMFQALSDGDMSTLQSGVKLIDEDDIPVIVTETDSVTDELYTRLSFLGYMQLDPDALPEEVAELLHSHTVTEYGQKHLPDFFGAQLSLEEQLDGNLAALRTFMEAYAPMWDYQDTLPLDHLLALRHFFSHPQHALKNDLEGDTSKIFELFKDLGLVNEVEDKNLVAPSLFGATTIPFLLDILIHAKGGDRLH